MNQQDDKLFIAAFVVALAFSAAIAIGAESVAETHAQARAEHIAPRHA